MSDTGKTDAPSSLLFWWCIQVLAYSKIYLWKPLLENYFLIISVKEHAFKYIYPSISVTLIYWTIQTAKNSTCSSLPLSAGRLNFVSSNNVSKPDCLKGICSLVIHIVWILENCNPNFQDENFRSMTCERSLHLKLASGQNEANLENL